MADSYDVNLPLVSKFGFRKAGPNINQPTRTPALESPLPLMTTTLTLNGELRDIPPLASKVLSFSSINTFTFSPGNTSTTALLNSLSPAAFLERLQWYTSGTSQQVYITNSGTEAISISSTITFSLNNTSPVIANFLPQNKIIQPGSTGSFDLSYYGTSVGEFFNFLLFETTSDARWHKVSTEQQVNFNFNFKLNPPTFSGVITDYGQTLENTFTLLTEQGTVGSIQATTDNPAFRVVSLDTATVTVLFDPFEVGYANGTYIGNINVGANTVNKTASMTAQVNINQSLFKNYGVWVSPAAPENSVIGISYDLINNVRYLTVGVGMGADGTSIYSQGGAPFTGTNALGILATASNYDYFAWATVYRFPIPDNQAIRYFSGKQNNEGLYLYRVKPERLSDGTYLETTTDYEQYFGLETSAGSMFIVDSDGYGNVSVALNQLRSLSDDEDLNRTLKNLTRAFHYYSAVDEPSRYYQLDAAPIQDGTVTQRFAGFNNSGTVLTSVVPLPIGF